MVRAAAVLVAVTLVGVTTKQPSAPDIDGFVARTYSTATLTLPYRLFAPKDHDKAKRYPLVLWLHGLGGSGTDNIQQISGDQVPGTRLWISKQNQAEHPAFVVAPQSSRGWLVPWNAADPQSETRVVGKLLDAIAAKYPIDLRRVYLLGQSMGAGAAWNLLTSQPKRFAAVLLVCPAGVGSLAQASVAARVPLWAIDGAVGTGRGTQNLIDALSQSGGHPKLTVYPDLGHEVWDRAFAEPDLANWLFAQSR